MKGKINFIIDVIMFVLMAFLAGIGLLIKYILLSGENRWIKYGQNVNLSLWDLDRHEWGTIHLWIAIALVVLLILHIILHWGIIICLYKKIIGNKTGRIIYGATLSIIALLLVVFPFIFKVDMVEIETGKERFGSNNLLEIKNNIKKESHAGKVIVNQKSKKVNIVEHHNIDESIKVKGYNTLNEISELYNVPYNMITKELNIPESTPGSSKLGHLRKQYGFTMSDIELIIYNYKKNSHEKID